MIDQGGGLIATADDGARPTIARPAAGLSGWALARAVSLPVIAGLLVRAIPVATADFPLNDGGLFYTMTRDLQAAGFVPPATTTYNDLGIPFAYPPLGFYLAGLLSEAGVALLPLFQFLPLLFAALTIPVVYLLAREILGSTFKALIATWAFALLPRSFEWLVVGGGLTRSLGLLLGLLAILEGLRFFRTSRRRDGVAMGILAGLTALSHPEAALFTGLSLFLMFLAYGRTRRVLAELLALAGLAALIAAPWWLTAVSRDGLAPFLSGGQATIDVGVSFQYLVTFAFTDEPYLTFLGAIGLIGFLFEIARRRYLLPAWVVLLFVLAPRGAATSAMVPLSLLVAVAIDHVLFARLREPQGQVADDPARGGLALEDRFGRAVLIAGVVLGVIGAVKAPVVLGSPLHALPEPNRTAMGWIAADTPPTTRFLVVTGSQWFLDANSEWFPVLAARQSVATLQGYEWLGKAAWDAQARRNAELQECAYATRDCVEAWARANAMTDAWVYVPVRTIDTLSPTGDCCAGLRASLRSSSRYVVAYDGPGGTVFKPAS
jgi:hypothetical protein